ncbi:glycosyltransferase, group 2 family protein [delta proteobacterium NaphS2]|nr:glycosyltransferase, group 2 family protein [delta proteobacterium NaphS2]
MKKRYVIITPVKNEERYVEYTIQSIIKQTVLPAQWIIVDDNSSDTTFSIVKRYAKKYPWITAVSYKKSIARQSGGGVIRAFYYGFQNFLKIEDWHYVVKLDGDISIDSKEYFEGIFKMFRDNPKLGIAGGICYFIVDGKKVLEEHPFWHVRGPTKIYRRKCFEDIGGLVPALGWDGIDEYTAMAKGWATKSFKEYLIHHLEPTGSKKEEGGSIDRFRRQAIASYNTGLWTIYVLFQFLHLCSKKPYVIGAIYFIFAYLINYIKNEPVMVDRATKNFIRKMNKGRLLVILGIGNDINGEVWL